MIEVVLLFDGGGNTPEVVVGGRTWNGFFLGTGGSCVAVIS